MSKYIKRIGILLVAVMLLIACSGRLSFNPQDGLEGRWHAEFTAIYFGSVEPESDSVLTIMHTSDMSFSDEQFEIRINPTPPPLFGGGGVRAAYWSGLYDVTGDTLILIDQYTNQEIERYRFLIESNTLNLAYIPRIDPNQGDSLAIEIPLYGGLPWGRAFMWHAGDFYRNLDH